MMRSVALAIVLSGCGGSASPSVSLKLVRTVVVLPDADYHYGGFVRINYVSSTDRFLVTFGATSMNAAEGNGFVWKEYTTDMVETGRAGRLVWNQSGDMGSALVDNTYYFVTFPLFPDDGPTNGWRVRTYDATTMQKQKDLFLALPGDAGTYQNNDPMVTWVNGQLDISCQYNVEGHPPDVFKGSATYHRFLDADLNSIGERILSDAEHIGGSSMVYVDGVYHLVTSKSFIGGDLMVMKYDQNWKYLGSKDLGLGQAHWSTGLQWDGKRFYVAYLDNSQWALPPPKYFPIYLNAHVGVFDADWNRLADAVATDFSASKQKAAGRPWVLVHGRRLYLAYDVDDLDLSRVPAELMQGQAWVTIYDLVEGS